MIYQKIKELTKKQGISVNKLELELGFAKGSLCKIDKNKPSSERLQKIADFFGVQIDYLTGASEYKTKEEMFQQWDDNTDLEELRKQIEDAGKGVTINVLGEVAAGIPIEAVEDIVDTEEISPEMAITGEFFLD